MFAARRHMSGRRRAEAGIAEIDREMVFARGLALTRSRGKAGNAVLAVARRLARVEHMTMNRLTKAVTDPSAGRGAAFSPPYNVPKVPRIELVFGELQYHWKETS